LLCIKNILEVLKIGQKIKRSDFIFMDADKQRYGKYFKLIYPLLSRGAILVVDNAGDYLQYMQDFFEEYLKIKDAATYMLNIDHGLFMLIKKGGQNLMPYLKIYFPLLKNEKC